MTVFPDRSSEGRTGSYHFMWFFLRWLHLVFFPLFVRRCNQTSDNRIVLAFHGIGNQKVVLYP